MPAHTKQMMYAETPTPVGYPGGMVPAHAYYPSMNGHGQLRDIDEISHRGENPIVSCIPSPPIMKFLCEVDRHLKAC